MAARARAAWGVGVATSAIVLMGCPGTSATDPAGNPETDRIARVVADAISYPRRDDADGLVRATLATTAGQDGRITVLAAEDLDAEEPSDPLARLVFRIHVDGTPSGLPAEPPVTACYSAEFNHYGIIDQPHRMDCPSGDTEPIVPPPRGPAPTLPADARTRLQAALESLSAAQRIEPDAVVAAIGPLDLTDTTPEIVARRGAIGVAIRSGDDCLLARVASRVDVWIPSRVELQPGELGCDAHAAAAGQAFAGRTNS
jgi:hypothetical protein